MWVVKLVLGAAAVYGAVVAMMYAAQTWLLFPTQLAVAFGPPLPEAANQLAVDTPDGERLRGVHIPPLREGDPLVVLGFGGNAWHAESVAGYLHALYPAADIVAFHYRGYRPSTGRPSTTALVADAPVIYDHVETVVGTKPVVAVGFSIGSGVVASLATRRPLAGVILVSPFDSLQRLARDLYPWLPVRRLLRHCMAVAELVRDVRVPVAIIAAENDSIVPPRRTEPVRQAATNLILDRIIAGADHNDLYHHPAFRAAMAEALTRIGTAPAVN